MSDWKLVPVEPTAEMLNTWAQKWPEPAYVGPHPRREILGWTTVKSIYQAMLKAAPSAPTQGADARPVAIPDEPVLWWNGFRKDDDERDGLSGPSFSPTENTWHDIPLYAGVNPCNLAAPTPSTQAVGEPSHHDLNERITDLETAMDGVTQEMLDGGWNARSLSKYAKSLEEKLAAIPVTSALTDERIGELAAQYSSALRGPDSGKWDFAFDNYEPLCEFARAVIKESMGGEPK